MEEAEAERFPDTKGIGRTLRTSRARHPVGPIMSIWIQDKTGARPPDTSLDLYVHLNPTCVRSESLLVSSNTMADGGRRGLWRSWFEMCPLESTMSVVPFSTVASLKQDPFFCFCYYSFAAYYLPRLG